MRTNNSKFIYLLMAGVLVLSACQAAAAQVAPTATPGRSRTAGAGPTALPTRTIVPVTSVNADGTLVLAGPEISAAFVASGNVVAVHVTPGQAVKIGDLRAELDDVALQTTLQQAQQRPQDERLARAYLARQNYKTAVRRYSVVQRSEGFVVPRRREQE